MILNRVVRPGRLILAVATIVTLSLLVGPQVSAHAATPAYTYDITVNGVSAPLYWYSPVNDENEPMPAIPKGRGDQGIPGDDEGAPVIITSPETYVTAPDGTVTGTVTYSLAFGLSVSAPQDHDVTAYLVDGTGVEPQQQCVLPAGSTSVVCNLDLSQSYASTLGPGSSTDLNLAFLDTAWLGDKGCIDGPEDTFNCLGFGFTQLTAFIPSPAPPAPEVQPASVAAFDYRFHPTFRGSFTFMIESPWGAVLASRYLGVLRRGAHVARYGCRFTGRVKLLVRHRTRMGYRTSRPKIVSC